MSEPLIHIEAFDCLPFSDQANTDVLQEFIRSHSDSVFWFSSDHFQDEDTKLAEYDYRAKCWKAGRYVGEAIFTHNEKQYKITIKPRFGEKMLFRMLEEIFNVRITPSAGKTSKSDEWMHFIKRIISIIWLQKLANANLHGVPKISQKKEHRSQAIRGRLDVRKSIKPLYLNAEIVSSFREKHFDRTVAQMIFQAYQLLKKNFEIGKINIPDSAQEAINQVNSFIKHKEHITSNEYRNIRYKEIYLSWKGVVDLSWDIIKRNQLGLKQEKAKAGFGFFIDMAEVWEQYLRSLLTKNLATLGWHYRKEKQLSYKGFFYQRELVPDLVFYKGNKVAVWDAKYKRMNGNYWDIDRSDFFQIHTYIQYLMNHKEVKCGGLLYPFSMQDPNFEKYVSPYLLNENIPDLKFAIDGIELKESAGSQNYQRLENEFVDRIITYIT